MNLINVEIASGMFVQVLFETKPWRCCMGIDRLVDVLICDLNVVTMALFGQSFQCATI